MTVPKPRPPEPPRRRADCIDGPRPCPWVRCRHHLYLDATGDHGNGRAWRGRLAGAELEQLPATCALDVADDGPHRLHEIGAVLGLGWERVRQIQVKALEKMRKRLN